MYIISVLNQKGGSGKTTIATHFAHCLQIKGFDVLLIDSDPQGSARDWAAVRDDQSLSVVGIDRPTIERDIKHVSNKDFIIIDGAPQAADLAVSAIKVSNFILIPVQPSPYDIWAADALVNLVKQRIELTDGRLKAAFIISRSIRGSRISLDVRRALNSYGLPIFDAYITQRVSYPVSAAEGRTVLDMEPNSIASNEIRTMVDEFMDHHFKDSNHG